MTGRDGAGAADGLPGAPHQLQVGHRPVRHQAVHLAPQRDGRQRVLEQPPGEQPRQLLHRLARGPCRGARGQVGRRGPACRPAAGSPRLPTLGPPPRAWTLGPAAPGLPWLPAPALRGSALPGPGARRRFTPKASEARSCLLRLIARDSPLPGKRARKRGAMTTAPRTRPIGSGRQRSLPWGARASTWDRLRVPPPAAPSPFPA